MIKLGSFQSNCSQMVAFINFSQLIMNSSHYEFRFRNSSSIMGTWKKINFDYFDSQKQRKKKKIEVLYCPFEPPAKWQTNNQLGWIDLCITIFP